MRLDEDEIDEQDHKVMLDVFVGEELAFGTLGKAHAFAECSIVGFGVCCVQRGERIAAFDTDGHPFSELIGIVWIFQAMLLVLYAPMRRHKVVEGQSTSRFKHVWRRIACVSWGNMRLFSVAPSSHTLDTHVLNYNGRDSKTKFSEYGDATAQEHLRRLERRVLIECRKSKHTASHSQDITGYSLSSDIILSAPCLIQLPTEHKSGRELIRRRCG